MNIGGYKLAFVKGLNVPTVEAFHDYLLDTSAKIVERGEELEPLMFLLSKAGQMAIVPFIGTKDTVAEMQRSIVKNPMTRAAAIVFEAWVAEGVAGEPQVQPSENPNRREAIGISILTAGRQAMTFSPIKRPENTVTKATFEWLDEIKGKYEGRFVR